MKRVLFLSSPYLLRKGFPGGSDGKESACNTGDPGSIPGLGRSLGEGNGNPVQYSFLENPTDRGAWWASVHGVAKSRTQLNDQHSTRRDLRRAVACPHLSSSSTEFGKGLRSNPSWNPGRGKK